MRLHDAHARFIVQLQADGRSPHTVAQYRRHVRRFSTWLEAEQLPDDVAALEPEHVARFLASAEAVRRPDGRAKRTGSLNALRSSLRGFFDWTERAGLVARSPARVLRMARVGATPPKGLSANDVAALLAALAADPASAARRDRALLAFLLGTGARLALDVGRQRTSAVLVSESIQEGLEVRPQDPVHHAARRIAAHHGQDAVRGQIVGACRPTVLPSIPEALANPRAPLGLDGGIDGGLHGRETHARASGLHCPCRKCAQRRAAS